MTDPLASLVEDLVYHGRPDFACVIEHGDAFQALWNTSYQPGIMLHILQRAVATELAHKRQGWTEHERFSHAALAVARHTVKDRHGEDADVAREYLANACGSCHGGQQLPPSRRYPGPLQRIAYYAIRIVNSRAHSLQWVGQMAFATHEIDPNSGRVLADVIRCVVPVAPKLTTLWVDQ